VIQAVLDGLGSVLAFLYELVPNYGIAIILFTLGIRVLLIPLVVRQVRSMHAMQAIQPRVRAIQTKYKGNRQKVQEETMALYREEGVNPAMGCIFALAQFPILFALFAVLQFPGGLTHIPQESSLYDAITAQETRFLGLNLLCNASQAGNQVRAETRSVPDAPDTLDCGTGVPVRFPYYALALLMVGTTFYQQRQMQRASPAPNPQQQMLTRIMPLLFGFWGFFFPAGLVLYWTTTNLVQIGQQYFILGRSREPAGMPAKATAAQEAKSGSSKRPAGKPGSKTSGKKGSGSDTTGSSAADKKSLAGSSKQGSAGDGAAKSTDRTKKSSSPKGSTTRPSSGRSGGRNGAGRKKRRNR
jgi:YidC/Oxa1 family membrane protein insertase